MPVESDAMIRAACIQAAATAVQHTELLQETAKTAEGRAEAIARFAMNIYDAWHDRVKAKQGR